MNFSLYSLQYDQYYVGTPPAKEVTFSNLNDNIGQEFLENMVKGFGKIEVAKIYRHPRTNKHLGIGKVSHIESETLYLNLLYFSSRNNFDVG